MGPLNAYEASVALDRAARRTAPLAKSTLDRYITAAGGHMEGLEYQFKGRAGLQNKIERLQYNYGSSLRRAQEGAFDGLRYTAVLDGKNYAKGMQDTLDGLEKAGFKVRTVVLPPKARFQR
jgi:hypothetical protein